MSNVPVSWKISSRRAFISARQDRLAFRRNNPPSPIFGPVVFSLLVGYMATGNFAIHLSSTSKGCRQSPFCAALLIGFACCRHCKSWSLVFSRGKLFLSWSMMRSYRLIRLASTARTFLHRAPLQRRRPITYFLYHTRESDVVYLLNKSYSLQYCSIASFFATS